MTATLARVSFDPLRDKSYERTALGRPVVDFLAWKRLGGLAESSLLDYEWALGRMCRMYPELELALVTDAEVMHVLSDFPPASRRVRRAAFNEFFKWARLTRRIAENPMDLLPAMRRPAQKVIDTFNDAECAALTGLPLRDGALMTVLLRCGLRKGEARRLCYRNVREADLVVLGGKGGKDRLVPFGVTTGRAIAELAILEGLDDRDHLWYDRPGGRGPVRRSAAISETSFGRWWTRCVDAAGVRYRNPHVARHTFATNWLRKGGRLETLSIVMGHRSIRTTFDLYGHLDTRDVELDLALIEREDA